MPIDWKPLADLVATHRSFVLTSHVRPDCDAVGSEIGLALGLRSLGKEVRIINGDAPPPHIAFIDPDGMVGVLGAGATAEEAHRADVHVVLDTSAWNQLGPMADVLRASPAKRLVIDHHVSGDDLGATLLKDETAEATGRLVLDALTALGVELTPQIAAPLFYAIATDTGWFRFASVTDKTYAAVGRLVAAGARPAEAFATLYDRNTLGRVTLHGRVVAGMQLAAGGRLAHASATAEDFRLTGAEVSDTEDVVNRLLSVAGVEVAALFVEVEPGVTKASLRSRSDFDVRRVAERFGGGGHLKAAGVRVEGPLGHARAQVLAALELALQA